MGFFDLIRNLERVPTHSALTSRSLYCVRCSGHKECSTSTLGSDNQPVCEGLATGMLEGGVLVRTCGNNPLLLRRTQDSRQQLWRTENWHGNGSHERTSLRPPLTSTRKYHGEHLHRATTVTQVTMSPDIKRGLIQKEWMTVSRQMVSEKDSR